MRESDTRRVSVDIDGRRSFSAKPFESRSLSISRIRVAMESSLFLFTSRHLDRVGCFRVKRFFDIDVGGSRLPPDRAAISTLSRIKG